jgi:polyisoprenoid-binding protein YceI
MKTLLLTLFALTAVSASAEIYKVDTTASKIEWTAAKKIGSTHNGEIKIKSGEVTTDAKGIVTSANFTADMKSISNLDLKEKPDMQAKLIGHLSSDDFFKVEKFPESTFKLTSLTPEKTKGVYKVKGELTMLGKTEPIEFPAKMTIEKGTLTGSGKVTLERLKWGLQYGSGSIFKSLTADKIINDSFDLTLNIVAKK